MKEDCFMKVSVKYMRAFAEAWPDFTIVQQVVGQLPWGHNLALLSKMKDQASRLVYAQAALEHGWSHEIETFMECRKCHRLE
jgi:predicted nuclease of restriction endonuclease-like (RecB) superfamily